MAAFLAITNTFTAGTKAKASEVNRNFTDLSSALSSGTSDILINGLQNNRLSNGNMTITGNYCAIYGYHTIDSTTTYDLATSTARAVFLGATTIYGTLHIASNAEALFL